ncbi:MAG: M50 family metallopeptidase [Bacteroidales bacterium]|nr:M50 family metallopeptidase [Bacteroidales bacterium]
MTNDNLLNNEYFFYGLIVLSFIVTRIPFVGKFFRVANTLIHESGHAIVALLTSGSIESIELFSNTEGAAVTRSNNKFGQFLVSVAGYPFSSASAFGLFFLIKYQQYNILLFCLASLALINIVLWIRNWYGTLWLLTFAAMLVAVYLLKNEFVTYCFSVVLSGIILTDSFYSTLELLYLSIYKSNNAGDATNLKKMTYVPAFFWASFFVAQSVFFIYEIIMLQ